MKKVKLMIYFLKLKQKKSQKFNNHKNKIKRLKNQKQKNNNQLNSLMKDIRFIQKMI